MFREIFGVKRKEIPLPSAEELATAEIAERQAKERSLQKGRIIAREPFFGGRYSKLTLEYKDRQIQAVAKPRDRETDYSMRGVPAGTQYRRARAVYIVDKSLEAGVVPPTVIRHLGVEEEPMQLMEFIDLDSSTLSEDAFPENSVDRDQRITLSLLDYCTFNNDPESRNTLCGRLADKPQDKRRVFRVDTDLTFANVQAWRIYPHLADDLWNGPMPSLLRKKFTEKPNKDLWSAGLAGLTGGYEAYGDEDEKRVLISQPEWEACLARIKLVGKLLCNKDYIAKSEQDLFVYHPVL
jgi:hypothetical protein